MALADDSSPAFDRLLERFATDGRLVHVEDLPARAERHGLVRTALPSDLADRVDERPLWSHQAEAIDAIRAGRHTVIATGTASGKSRCYQLPIAEAVADPADPGTALLLFPTKALAHDQHRALLDADFPGLVAATYDGDATTEEKTWARHKANVILTNPEMLHGGLLPRHEKWATFLARLRYVVIDELHVLRGVFGSHVAHVLRRLRRLCAHHGGTPTFVFTSATIGQPEKLASALCGSPVTSITDDGSPRGPRRFALIDPPVLDDVTGVRSSANGEVASAAAALIDAGHRTITFCRSRKGTELIAADIARRLPETLAGLVAPYRAGYLADERRAIEDELATGSLRGVVATSALELGLDIGALDACVLHGFPGTIASMWQQSGRAGRRDDASVTVLVAGDDQLDRYLMRHPREVFDRPPEPAVVNPANPHVLTPHLACAAYELPLSWDDRRWWPETDLHDGIRALVRDDRLRFRRRRRADGDEPVAHWCGTGSPWRGVGLRAGATREITIIDHDREHIIGTVDEARALTATHRGAIYLHRGQSFEVIDLDLDRGTARVVETDDTTYTQPRTDTTIRVCSVETSRRVGAATLALGEVDVTTTVTGYQRRDTFSRRLLATEPLDLPEQTLRTRAFWYVVDPTVIDHLVDRSGDPAGSLHAAEHAAIGMLPLFAICDRWDVGGISTTHHTDTGGATIFVHDAHPGGAGVADLGWHAGLPHLDATLDAITACPCHDGCPSCVQSPKCGNGNEPLDKHGARTLLAGICGR